MKFHKGDLFYIEMRSGICQVLDVFKADENETVYYFRKIFVTELLCDEQKDKRLIKILEMDELYTYIRE